MATHAMVALLRRLRAEPSYSAATLLTQDHALSLVTGSSTRSADLHVIGRERWAPSSQTGTAATSWRRAALASFGTRDASAPRRASSPSRPAARRARWSRRRESDGATRIRRRRTRSPQSVPEYTLGATASVAPNDRWIHSFVAGIDGYHSPTSRRTPRRCRAWPTPRCARRRAALNAGRCGRQQRPPSRRQRRDARIAHLLGGTREAPFRATSTTYRVGRAAGPQRARLRAVRPTDRGHLAEQHRRDDTGERPRSTTPVFASGGIRLERDSRLARQSCGGAAQCSASRQCNDYGRFTMKLRAAYGEGIRPPATSRRVDVSAEQPGMPRQRLSARRSRRARRLGSTSCCVSRWRSASRASTSARRV